MDRGRSKSVKPPPPSQGAGPTSQRSPYSAALGERLLRLTRELRASPGDPDRRRALNDAFFEARRNRSAIVKGEILVAAMHALAASKPHGPLSAGGQRLMRQVDPTNARVNYSRVVTHNLREAEQRFRLSGSRDDYRELNRWLAEARGPNAVVSLELLKRAHDTWASAKSAPGSPSRGRRPVEQWVNFSSVPGAQGGNYAGIETRGPGGDITRIQARLRARMQLDQAGQWTVVQMQAVGPQVTRNGKVVSERFKEYDLNTTNPTQARVRALQLLRHDGITTLSEGQRRTRDAQPEPIPIVGRGEQRWEAPGIRYSNSPDQPNRMLGPAPPAHTVERSAFNLPWQTERNDKDPYSVAMFVPNLVWEVGGKFVTGKKPDPFVFTAQPLLGFFPTSGGFRGFREQTNNSALVRSTLHPAGFYPGDAAGARWKEEFRSRPDTTPALRDSSIGYAKHLRTDNWWQCFGNVPNMFLFWRSSAHCRAIKQRDELRAGLYESRELFVPRGKKAFEVKQSLLSPYTWGQVQVKGGVANIGGKPGAFITAPLQGELGFYVYTTTNPRMPNPPSTDPVDYRIVNGVKTGDPATIARQFSDVRRRFGLTLTSESVLPQWDAVNARDRSAGVYVQVPAEGHWTAETLARKLNAIGIAIPAYKELRFVTAKSLADSNPALRAGAAQPGTQLNTGLRVAVGGPGLFLPDDN